MLTRLKVNLALDNELNKAIKAIKYQGYQGY